MIKMLAGITLTGFWLGAASWYSWHQFGFDRLLSLPPAELGQFVAGLFLPVAIIWSVVLLWPGLSAPQRSLDDALAARIEALNLSLDLTQDKLGQTTKVLTGPMEAWHSSVLQAIEKSLTQHVGKPTQSEGTTKPMAEAKPSSPTPGRDQVEREITQVLREEIASLQQATRNAEMVVARAADMVNEPIEALSRETNKALKEQFASLCKAIRLAQETQLASPLQDDNGDVAASPTSEDDEENSTVDGKDDAEGPKETVSTTVPATIQAMLAQALTEETENHSPKQGTLEPEANADDVDESETAWRARETETDHRQAIDRLKWLRRVTPSGETQEAVVSPASARAESDIACRGLIDEPPDRLLNIGLAIIASLDEPEALTESQKLLSTDDGDAFFELLGRILSESAKNGPVDRLSKPETSAFLEEYCKNAAAFADAVRQQGASPEAIQDMERAPFIGVASLIQAIRQKNNNGRSPALQPGNGPGSTATTPPVSG